MNDIFEKEFLDLKIKYQLIDSVVMIMIKNCCYDVVLFFEFF